MIRRSLLIIFLAVIVFGIGFWAFTNLQQTGLEDNSEAVFKLPEGTLPRDINADLADIVSYTEAGFAPPVIQTRVGQSLRFLNRSETDLLIVFDRQPNLNQKKSAGPGQEATFTFDQAGEWTFLNQLVPEHTALVIIK